MRTFVNAILLSGCVALAAAFLAVSWLSVVSLAELAEETDEFDND